LIRGDDAPADEINAGEGTGALNRPKGEACNRAEKQKKTSKKEGDFE